MVILEKMKNFKVKKEKILNSKDFVVLALLSNTFFLSVINAERFPQRGQVGNKITKKQSLEGVPEQGSRACNCFVPHGRRRLYRHSLPMWAPTALTPHSVPKRAKKHHSCNLRRLVLRRIEADFASEY